MPRISDLKLSLILFLVLSVPAASAGKDTARETAAVVSSLTGTASVVLPSGSEAKVVHLFDWIPAGSVIAVKRNSKLTLAYANGTRYEMKAGSKATLSMERPKTHSGVVHRLDPVPPMPRFVSIAAASQPGTRSAAVRMRGDRPERINNLYPSAGTTTLPDSTVLRFSQVAGVAQYSVLLEDAAGNVIFKTDIKSAQAVVPAGLLNPGTRYYWEAWSSGMTGPVVRGESEFVTLTLEEVKLRAALKEKMENKGDAESLALLAEVDRRLGLLLEARDEFRAALARSPSDSAFRGILENMERDNKFP